MNRVLLLLLLVLPVGCYAQSKTKHEPECRSGDTSTSVNVVGSLKCVSGKWTEDKEADARREKERKEDEEREALRQKHLQNLWDDLRTRVVSVEELEEIMKLGPNVIPKAEGGGSIDWCGWAQFCSLPPDYKQEEEARRVANEKIFSDALYNQFRMRLLKEKEEREGDVH